MSYVHHLLSRIPDDLPDYVEEVIATANSLYCKYPPDKLAGAVERNLKERLASWFYESSVSFFNI